MILLEAASFDCSRGWPPPLAVPLPVPLTDGPTTTTVECGALVETVEKAGREVVEAIAEGATEDVTVSVETGASVE